MDATRGYRPRRRTVKVSLTATASCPPRYLAGAVPVEPASLADGHRPTGRARSPSAAAWPQRGHLPAETSIRPEPAHRPWVTQIHRTHHGFADWNDTLTPWAIRVMRASARRTDGRSDPL